MATIKLTALVLIGQVALAGAALADEMSTTTTDGSGAGATLTDGSDSTDATATQTGGTSNVGAADALSPGNRKIADALFDSQTISDSGQQAWSLDQIAAAKQSGQGWGEIFHQMKADGLIQAKNLGQVVSGQYRPPTNGIGDTTVVITTATGATSAVADVGAAAKTHGSAGKSVKHDGAAGADRTASMGAPGTHGVNNAYGHLGSGVDRGALAGGAGVASAGSAGVAAGAAHGGGYGGGHVR